MRALITSRRTRMGDDGFTLMEVLISVIILSVISAGLFGIVLQYLKTSGDTRARLSESTDQQFISTYWQTDVSSLGRRTLSGSTFDVAQSVFVGSAGPSGCGTSEGTVVVAFAWVEYPVDSDSSSTWNTTPQEVAYVRTGAGAPYVLKRVRCRAGVAEVPQTVAHNLTAPPTIACDTTCTATTLPNRVSMTFTVRDANEPDSAGYTTTVSADRRQER